MNNIDKEEILNNMLLSLEPHILALENDIAQNPQADIEGKPLRSNVLLDFISKKQVLESEKNSLTNQG
jgi:hypothetical protein